MATGDYIGAYFGLLLKTIYGMGSTRIFELGAARWQSEGHGGQKKIAVIGLSTGALLAVNERK